MHLRVVYARSGNEVRRYAQLMRSYRNKQGVAERQSFLPDGRQLHLPIA
jgi:hypothetical protein